MMSGGTNSRLLPVTSSPVLNVNTTRGIQLSSRDSAAAAAAAAAGDGGDEDDEDDDNRDEDGDADGSLRYPRRKREDDTLYIILGVIIGAILIGVLVALFVCARQQQKQRLLLGSNSLSVL